MTIILEQSTIPETGTFEIHKTVNIPIFAKQAQRKVDTWLLNEVSYMMGAEEPTLVIGERTVWRVLAYFSAPGAGHVGVVGTVDVDVQTGELYSTDKAKTCIWQRAKILAEKLPLFTPKTLAPEYAAKNVPAVPHIHLQEDGELVIVAPAEV